MAHKELGQHLSANGKNQLEYYGLVHKPDGNSRAGCFLYTKPDDEESKKVLEFLLSQGIAVWECAASSAGEPIDVPTLITREGQLRGMEGAEAWIDWFVNAPEYQR